MERARDAARPERGPAFGPFPRDPSDRKFLPPKSFSCPSGSASCALGFTPPELPVPEPFPVRDSRPFGCAANGQWRSPGPSGGSGLQKPRLSRGSYLESRKNP
ncbi:sentrin-specific protease 1-like, partial [Corapipo altera]